MSYLSAGAERDLPLPPPEQQSAELKREANRRLAIHRARRNDRSTLQSALPGMETALDPEEYPSRNKSVADRVAARYAKAPSYSEMLAYEARNMARAAEAAATAAGEVRDAAQAILIGLDVDLNDDGDPEEISPRSTSPQTNLASSSPRPYETRSYETNAQARAHALITEVEEDEAEIYEEEPIAPVQTAARQTNRVSPRVGGRAQSPPALGRGSASRRIRPRGLRFSVANLRGRARGHLHRARSCAGTGGLDADSPRCVTRASNSRLDQSPTPRPLLPRPKGFTPLRQVSNSRSRLLRLQIG